MELQKVEEIDETGGSPIKASLYFPDQRITEIISKAKRDAKESVASLSQAGQKRSVRSEVKMKKSKKLLPYIKEEPTKLYTVIDLYKTGTSS
jgi:hypothetical protein